ncbi:MAG: metal-dependent hydrolase [Terracidiphilus sp.]|jgi:L-ascorbate metabolism protein UlaG (beta-lactamase superfamily)
MTKTPATRITWLGHATVLIETAQGTNLLIDPFISHNPKFPQNFVLPSKLDYILLTHGHGDHISDAVPVAEKHRSTVVAIYELADYMKSRGARETIGMNLGGAVTLGSVTATMVEATHSAAASDEHGTHYVGVAAGFVLTIPGGPVLYHAGDTGVFGDMQLIRELYRPRVVMLPIGGFYTMGPQEAAMACRLLTPEVVLPIHFGTFPPLKGTPEELSALVEPQVKVVHWKPGEEFSA